MGLQTLRIRPLTAAEAYPNTPLPPLSADYCPALPTPSKGDKKKREREENLIVESAGVSGSANQLGCIWCEKRTNVFSLRFCYLAIFGKTLGLTLDLVLFS